MTKKQKRMLVRIIISFVLFAVLDGGGAYGGIGRNKYMDIICHLSGALPVIGYDIVYKAVRNISHGQVFDETS